MPTQQEHSIYLNQLLTAIHDIQDTLFVLQARYVNAISQMDDSKLNREKEFAMKNPIKCVA